AEAYLARELARTRARHGDVTGLSELRAAHGHARRARTVAVLRVALWSAILVAPAFTPWPLTLYAASSLGWVLHWRRDRHR
ncbi:MAG TPA: hypothetical protein VMK65_08055, partial [Longimicrobiales bacterium]|nr:hypothetical protein [Longimicrobiales bacterium]